MEEKTIIVQKYSYIIKKLIKKFYGLNYEDLYQAGVMGLLKALENYKYEANTKFSTYAYDYVFGEMYQLALSLKSLKMNRENLKIYKEIERAREYLTQFYGKEPSIKELSLFLEMEENKVADVIINAREILSLNDPLGEEETERIEFIADKKESNWDDLITLNDAVSSLPSPEKEIIISRYYKDLTQSETASNLGLSQVMVSRLEKKTLSLIKNNIAA